MSEEMKTPNEPNSIRWLAGWYVTKLHAVVGPKPIYYDGSVESACGAFVYAEPKHEWGKRRLERGVMRCLKCSKMFPTEQ